MSRYHSYLNTSTRILEEYQGEEPLSAFLKRYFSSRKKFGSTDRRQVSRLCYSYFRPGKSLPGLTIPERIITGLFLSADEPSDILEALRPAWNANARFSIDEKENFLAEEYPLDKKDSFLIDQVFPWKDMLSAGVDHLELCRSFFSQPRLFIRLRPGMESQVKDKLEQKDVSYQQVNQSCISLPNGTAVQNILELDKEAVVQDLNSQKTGNFFQLEMNGRTSHVWDCCAGSGGKSIMAYDQDPTIQLTVTDIRKSILSNLESRFRKAGIFRYRSMPVNLASAEPVNPLLELAGFDLVICDAPCSGSGTWQRTPEQLYFFDPAILEKYINLQRSIVKRAIPYIKAGGRLVYITCSVFRQENEELLDYIREISPQAIIEQQELLNGTDKLADSLFVATVRF